MSSETHSALVAAPLEREGVAFRYVPEIDALRGLAAMVVVFEHSFFQGRTDWWLHILLNGQAAVVLFFVMSGFALGAQMGDREITLRTYAGFIVRRLFRLVPVTVLSIGFAYLVLLIFWDRATPLDVVFWNLMLRTYEMNPPLWSIAVELFCSLTFPLLYACFRSGGLAANLVLCAALVAIWAVLPDPYETNLRFEWIRYIACFQFGLVAARFGRQMVAALKFAKVPVFMLCIVLAGFTLPGSPNATLFCRSMLFAIAIAIIIHESGQITTFLLRIPQLKFIGIISFSLYVLHMPVINALYHAYYGAFSPATLSRLGHTANTLFFLSTIAISLPLAFIAYRMVEMPLNRLGRKIEKRITPPIATQGQW